MALSTLEIAKRVLEICAKPMHVDEIAQHSVAMGLSPAETVQELSRKLSTSLAQHVKSRHAFFRKIKNDTGGYKRGIYALKKQGILPRHRHHKIVLDSLPHVSTQYTGAAGEHAVYAELLFRGFNASIMCSAPPNLAISRQLVWPFSRFDNYGNNYRVIEMRI